jgi:hypothetical protein
MKVLWLAIGFMLALPGVSLAADATCKTPVGACFSIHGRLSAYNGTPTYRIWPVGSHRMLGVYDDHGNAEPVLPVSVLAAIHGDAFGKAFYGDYQVCPMTKSIAGRMQMVCVKSGAHLTVQPTSQPR